MTRQTLWKWVHRAISLVFWLLLYAMSVWQMIKVDGARWRARPFEALLVPLPVALPALVASAIGLGSWVLAERLLRGKALLTARFTLAAFVAFWVMVVAPSLAHHVAGDPILNGGTLNGVMLWLAIVVPTVGVLIAFAVIGDGRPKPGKTKLVS